MKEIESLLKRKLVWKQIEKDKSTFKSDSMGEGCFLKMNNFPEEPLYTLFWNNESLDFDDKPINWKIHYL